MKHAAFIGFESFRALHFLNRSSSVCRWQYIIPSSLSPTSPSFLSDCRKTVMTQASTPTRTATSHTHTVNFVVVSISNRSTNEIWMYLQCNIVSEMDSKNASEGILKEKKNQYFTRSLDSVLRDSRRQYTFYLLIILQHFGFLFFFSFFSFQCLFIQT